MDKNASENLNANTGTSTGSPMILSHDLFNNPNVINRFKSRELNHIEENFEISQDEDFPSISR